MDTKPLREQLLEERMKDRLEKRYDWYDLHRNVGCAIFVTLILAIIVTINVFGFSFKLGYDRGVQAGWCQHAGGHLFVDGSCGTVTTTVTYIDAGTP